MWDDVCGWARPRLPLFAGGELAGADRRKVERHLIGCSLCRTRLESLQAALGALHGLAARAMPSPDAPSLWPALARQIREERRPAAVISLWSRPAPWIGAAMAASALVVAFAANSRGGKTAAPPAPHVATNATPSPPPANPAPRRPASRAVSEVNPAPAPAVADNGSNRRPENDALAQGNPSSNPPRHGGQRTSTNPPAPAAGVRMPAEPTH